MIRGTALFLRAVLALIAVMMLAICLWWLPRTIGNFSFGGYDPILIGLYIPAVPFFVALYQAAKLLDNIDKNQVFSTGSVKAFRNIKLCAITICVMFSVSMPYIFHVANKDDAPGIVLIGCIIVFASLVIATFANLLQVLILNALEIKSENDLTV